MTDTPSDHCHFLHVTDHLLTLSALLSVTLRLWLAQWICMDIHLPYGFNAFFFKSWFASFLFKSLRISWLKQRSCFAQAPSIWWGDSYHNVPWLCVVFISSNQTHWTFATFVIILIFTVNMSLVTDAMNKTCWVVNFEIFNKRYKILYWVLCSPVK
jgi:hypothetical protein